MQEPHIRDVVNVDLHLQHYHERLAVEFHSKDGGWKQEFADHGLALNLR